MWVALETPGLPVTFFPNYYQLALNSSAERSSSYDQNQTRTELVLKVDFEKN
jgi:hypothetical protein